MGKLRPKEAKPEAQESKGDEERHDVLDHSADTHVYPADLGNTVTSHGDGSPSISPQLVERREELAEHDADPDRENKALAEKLGIKK